MNRRTLLKGAAVGAGMMLPSLPAVHRVWAQGPSYVGEVIYQFTEFTGTEYSLASDGLFSRVSRDGVIAGRDVVGGVAVPVTWDLAGERTLLDTTGVLVAKTGGVYAATNGYVAGTVYETTGADAPGIGVLWTNGVLSRLVDEDGLGVRVNVVNEQGTVAGSMNSSPCRWADGSVERLPLPEGATSAEVVDLSDAGDGYVVARGSEGIIGSPSIWRRDGTLDEIQLPAELVAPEIDTIAFISFPGVFPDGSFVLRSSWSSGDAHPSGSWLYEGGVPTPIANNGGTTMAAVNSALTAGNMIGSIYAGDEPRELAGPAQWIDGVPYLIEPATAGLGELEIDSLTGMTADGALVGWTGLDLDPLTLPSILVLRPTT